MKMHENHQQGIIKEINRNQAGCAFILDGIILNRSIFADCF